MHKKFETSGSSRSSEIFETEPLGYLEIIQRLKHEPGTDEEELGHIRDGVKTLKVGENYNWSPAADIVITVTRIDEKTYKIIYPGNWVEAF